jgi:hypothetical protein
MQQFSNLKTGAIVLLLCVLALIVTGLFLDDMNKPVVYRSASTGAVVKVTLRGKEIPVDEAGDRCHLVWVK